MRLTSDMLQCPTVTLTTSEHEKRNAEIHRARITEGRVGPAAVPDSDTHGKRNRRVKQRSCDSRLQICEAWAAPEIFLDQINPLYRKEEKNASEIPQCSTVTLTTSES